MFDELDWPKQVAGSSTSAELSALPHSGDTLNWLPQNLHGEAHHRGSKITYPIQLNLAAKEMEIFHALPGQIWMNRMRDVNEEFGFACFFAVTFDVNLCNASPMRGKNPDFQPVSRYFWYRQFAANKHRNTIFSNLQPACVVRSPQTLHGGRACRAHHKRCQPFFDLITCRMRRSGKLPVLNLLTGQN